MAIRFIHPWLLWLIPLAVFAVSRWYYENRAMQLFRRRLIAALRLLLLFCLILALAGTQINYRVSRQSVVFVVDLSASCQSGREKAENFIKEALRHKEPQDRAAVVVFGENARVEQALGTENTSRLESLVERDHSNLEDALKLAGALLPGDSRRRIVLLSDGRENDGDARREAQNLANRDVRVDACPLSGRRGPEVRLDNLQVPARTFAGENLNIKLKINSNIETPAKLRIYQDEIPQLEDNVHLNKGDNQLIYPLTVTRDGFHVFKAMVEVRRDLIAENNEAFAYSTVKGPARVLLLEGQPGEGNAIASALRSLRIPVDVAAPGQVNPGLEQLSPYSLTILCDVPAEALAGEVMESIQSAVRDLGMGLVMVGGEESFGPGGYLNTPIEQALPVHMELRGKKKIPSLGLVLVIDKSGSMSETSGGVCKVDLAKDAAAQASSILNAQDRVGVVAFDSIPKWVVKPQAVRDLDAIQSDIGTIRADGGTSIYPALDLAYKGLKDAPTKYKHIILLTDGMSAADGDYYFLAQRMEVAGITMSTVAVGKDADINLLSALAESGHGRYYFCDDVRKVPRIFTKETIKARRDYLVEEDFYPAMRERSPLLEGIPALPPLHGYVGTSPKASAQTILVSRRDDPVLAGWQYGLGRAVAYTTDGGNRWSSPWVAWPGFNGLWGNIVSWCLPRSESASDLAMTANISGTAGVIQVESRDYKQTENLTAIVVGPDYSRREIKLSASSPGVYQAGFPARQPGIYMVNLLRNGSQNTSVATAAISLPYSPEYRYSGTDTSFLRGITRITGGGLITEPVAAFADNLPPAHGGTELWFWLLLAAALLLPCDIAARRLNLSGEDFYRLRIRLRGTKTNPEPSAATVERLRSRKDAAQQAHSQKHSGPISVGLDHTKPENQAKNSASIKAPAKTGTVPPAARQENISRLLEARKRGNHPDT